MMTTLEQRRQAIAAALREAMTEPLAEAATAMVVEPSPPLSETDLSWDDDEDITDWRDDTSVPPLETTGSFSRTASLALFGHA